MRKAGRGLPIWVYALLGGAASLLATSLKAQFSWSTWVTTLAVGILIGLAAIPLEFLYLRSRGRDRQP